MTGRKATRSNISKASTAVSRASRSASAKQDVERAKETVETYNQQLEDLKAELEAEFAELLARVDPVTEPLERVVINPRKTDIQLQVFTLAWVPYYKNELGILTQAYASE